MCGRYARYAPLDVSSYQAAVLEEMALDLANISDQREDQFNIAPTQQALVVAKGEKGYEAKALKWGLVPTWAKDPKIGANAINARVESVVEKPMFRASFKKRRCLVPASGYYEWKGAAKAKQPYFIHDPAGKLLMFAGLWEGWRPNENEPWMQTFTIITGEPGKVSRDIHDRQPVILPAEHWQAWFDSEPADALDLVQQAPEAELVYHPVGKAVGSPRNQGPELIKAITL